MENAYKFARMVIMEILTLILVWFVMPFVHYVMVHRFLIVKVVLLDQIISISKMKVVLQHVPLTISQI